MPPVRREVVPLPRGDRARKAYQALRKLGFRGGYAASVVNMLEGSRSNMERWTIAQRALLYGPESGKKWLKARGYV